jgi:hypothetical protein
MKKLLTLVIVGIVGLAACGGSKDVVLGGSKPADAATVAPATTAPAPKPSALGSYLAWSQSHMDDIQSISDLSHGATDALNAHDSNRAADLADQVASGYARLEISVPTGTPVGDASHLAFGTCKTAWRHSATAVRSLDTAKMDAVGSELTDCASAMQDATALIGS